MSSDQAQLLADAIEEFGDAYRQRYRNPSTEHIRSNAPLRMEMGELFLALNNFRLEQARRT